MQAYTKVAHRQALLHPRFMCNQLVLHQNSSYQCSRNPKLLAELPGPAQNTVMSLFQPRSVPALKTPRSAMAGDSVMLISPASPAVSEGLSERIKARLSLLGYSTQIGPNADRRSGFLAGEDHERLGDLHNAFSSQDIRAIVCTRGGYGSGRIINSIDFSILASNPKIFIGSSDLTTILNGCILEAGITALHGPTMESLMSEDTPDFTWQSLLYNLSGSEKALGSICSACPKEYLRAEQLKSGRATGRLLGGNLAVLLSTVGTRFFPSLDDSILFLEDVGEAPFRIDRNLTHLINLGLLEKVRGFALGVFERCSYRPEEAALKQSLRDVVIERLLPFGKPLVLGLPFGHTPYNATLPVGALATLDADNSDLLIEELAVCKA